MNKAPGELMHDASFRRLLVYTGAFCFCFFFAGLTTCTIHMNSYNEAEAKSEIAEIEANAKAKLEKQQQEHAAEMERINAIQKMIDETKVNPIAARCAIDGWDDSSSSEKALCEAAAHTTPIIVNTPGVTNND